MAVLLRLTSIGVLLVLTACGGGGGSVTTVPPPTTYSIGGTVSNMATGLQIILTNNGGDSLTVGANGNFVFKTMVTSNGTYSVSIATQPTGQTCSVTGGSGTAGANVTSVQVNCAAPAAQYVYLTNQNVNTISQYSIAANGSLTPLNPATVSTGPDPQNVTIDPTNHYVYVATFTDSTITEYVIGADGTLTADTLAQIVELPGSYPWGISVSHAAPHLFVVDYGNMTILPYVIGPSGHLQGAIAPAPTGRTPWWSVVSPNGANLYVANNDDSTISQYLIAADASLVQLNPPTVATGKAPRGVTVDPSGHHAYVANFDDNTVSMYNITANGALSTLSPNTVSTGGTQPAFLRFDPTGHHLYVTNFTNGDVGSVAHFTVDANGILTAATPFTIATGKGPSMIQLDRTGRFAYVPNARDDTISQYSVAADGSLTPLGTPTLATGHAPIDLEMTY